MSTLRNSLVWSFAERYLSLLITIGSTLILARILTPTQIGIFSMCAAVTAVAGILRDFGISEYLIQEKDLTRQKLKAALGIALGVAWSIGAVVFVSRSVIADYYQEQGLSDVLAVLTLNFLILPFASPSFALLNREMAFRKVFAVQTTSTAIHATTAVVLAYQGHGYMSMAWAQVAAISSQVVILAFLRPEGTLLLPSLAGARAVLRYGSMFASSRVIETLARNAHEFVVARQFGFAAVGLFSRGFGLIELFHTNVASAILRVATPSFAADHRAGLPLTDAFARGTAIFTCIAWPFFGFTALMAADIIRLLFGPQWDAAAPIATILALAVMPTYLFALGPNILAATGNVRTRLNISLVFSPIHIAGVVVASFISLEAVAAVWFLTNLLMLLLYVHHLKRVLNASTGQLFSSCIPSLAVTGASAGAQVGTLLICRHFDFPLIVGLALVVFSGALSWLAAIWATQHPIFAELRRLLAYRRSSG
jgi:O-antigen/teichoic acid export membrane protein